MKHIISAAWVAPICSAPFRDGAVASEAGRIVAVGPLKEIRRAFPDALLTDAGNAVLLPGLINAHTHLELSDHVCDESHGGNFAGWLARRRAPRTQESITNAIEIAVAQCRRFGVVAVGDITKFPHLTRSLLSNSPLHVVSFGEVVALGKKRPGFQDSLDRAVDTTHATARVWVGISPHAPYTVEAEGYARCLEVARAAGLALSTHLAESADEAVFLSDHAGPLRELWDRIELWGAPSHRHHGGPIRFAQQLGLLDYPTVLAHVNYVDDDELAILAGGRASVVYCPRTHAYFGHPPHRFRDMLKRGINVAVGTDSCASSPDLNIVDDLRHIRRLAPEMTAGAIWELATLRAARALGLEHELGTLAPGKLAEILAFPLAIGRDPLGEVLDRASEPAILRGS